MRPSFLQNLISVSFLLFGAQAAPPAGPHGPPGFFNINSNATGPYVPHHVSNAEVLNHLEATGGVNWQNVSGGFVADIHHRDWDEAHAAVLHKRQLKGPPKNRVNTTLAHPSKIRGTYHTKGPIEHKVKVPPSLPPNPQRTQNSEPGPDPPANSTALVPRANPMRCSNKGAWSYDASWVAVGTNACSVLFKDAPLVGYKVWKSGPVKPPASNHSH